MGKEHYVQILKQLSYQISACKFKLGCKWVFKMDSENRAKFVTKWLQGNKVSVLRPSQNPDHNPMEDKRAKLERRVKARQPTNLTVTPVLSVGMSQLSQIPAAACQKLVERSRKHTFVAITWQSVHFYAQHWHFHARSSFFTVLKCKVQSCFFPKTESRAVPRWTPRDRDDMLETPKVYSFTDNHLRLWFSWEHYYWSLLHK